MEPLPAPPEPPLEQRTYRQLGTRRAIRDWAQGTGFPAWRKRLTDEQREAIRHYVTSGYRSINSALRQGKEPRRADARRIQALAEAVEGTTVPDDILVFRRADHHALGDLEHVPLEQLPGHILEDRGFMSTTLQEYKAVAFTNDPCDFLCCSPIGLIKSITVDRHVPPYMKAGVVMEIRVPKGTPGSYIGPESGLDGEEEVLLGRGTRMRIESARADGRLLWLVCQVLPRG